MKLTDYLRLSHLTERGFAAAIGVHQTTVHRIAKGEYYPSPETMNKIINATNGAVTLLDLLEGKYVKHAMDTGADGGT